MNNDNYLLSKEKRISNQIFTSKFFFFRIYQLEKEDGSEYIPNVSPGTAMQNSASSSKMNISAQQSVR